MPELAAYAAHAPAGVTEDLEREFEARLVDFSTLAFRVAFSVLRNREDAEEVAQEAFVKAHARIRQLRDRARFRGWLVRMTWRLALDRQRADRRRTAREAAQATAVPAPTALDTMVARERAEGLWRALDELPERLRVVIVLANIEELDLGEVAATLDVPEGTVKSRLFAARERLRRALR